MLTRAYLALDNFLVDKANDVVKAWNWTTGRTRADLANLIMIPSLSTFPATESINHDYNQMFFSFLIVGGMGIIYKKIYSHMDHLEEKASNNGVKDSKVEELKNGLSVWGPGFTTVGALVLSSPNKEGVHPLTNEFLGVGSIGMGISKYIMRTDYLPPRKNVLARAKDKLAEMASTYRGPITVPIR